PVECTAGASAASSPGLFNITLDFSGMASGHAIINSGHFYNCHLIGPNPATSTATISAISEDTNNTVTVTTTAPITCVPDMPIIISGTTNGDYDSNPNAFQVASCVDASNFKFQIGKPGLSSGATGTIHYKPLIGVSSHGGAANLSCCSVDWEN